MPDRNTAIIDENGHAPDREALRRAILLRPLQGKRGVGQFPKMLVQTMLPYQTPRYPEGHHQAGSPLPTWTHTNGAITLRVESGYHPQTNDLLGVPGGGTARLLINHIATNVVVRRSPYVDLGETISALLHTLGLHGAGDRYRAVREQLMRLAFARISYIDQRRGTGRSTQFAVKQALVADEIRFWETEGVQTTAERSGFGGGLHLTSTFFEEVLSGSVLVDPRVLTYFRKSPLAMDLYAWLTYKCAYMERCGRSDIYVSWQQLHAQFPASYESAKQFARRVRRALAEIQWIWPTLKYETPRGRLVLKKTRPHVPMP